MYKPDSLFWLQSLDTLPGYKNAWLQKSIFHGVGDICWLNMLEILPDLVEKKLSLNAGHICGI